MVRKYSGYTLRFGMSMMDGKIKKALKRHWFLYNSMSHCKVFLMFPCILLKKHKTKQTLICMNTKQPQLNNATCHLNLEPKKFLLISIYTHLRFSRQPHTQTPEQCVARFARCTLRKSGSTNSRNLQLRQSPAIRKTCILYRGGSRKRDKSPLARTGPS